MVFNAHTVVRGTTTDESTFVQNIPRFDANTLIEPNATTMIELHRAVKEVGFLTVYNTAISPDEVRQIIQIYRGFFNLSTEEKQKVDMTNTQSNRGWGALLTEKVDPNQNPDYKEVFDCGFELPTEDLRASMSVYAPNQWPEQPVNFHEAVSTYYNKACSVAALVLQSVLRVSGRSENDQKYLIGQFSEPMALLRSNFYPKLPVGATSADNSIAAHTDYGCVTLLATDGKPGLEVMMPNGEWKGVCVEPGEFVINFGEMLQTWSAGRIKATLHRVRGDRGDQNQTTEPIEERISVPLFYNPEYNTNIAAEGQPPSVAGEYLRERYHSTYLHIGTSDGDNTQRGHVEE